jgi:hypothetical protein
MMHYCYVIVGSDNESRLIAGEPDMVFGSNWRDNEHETIVQWEQINKRGGALGKLLENGWTPLRESPMAPEWTKTKTGISHSLAILQKDHER